MTTPRARQNGLLVRTVGNQVVVYDPKKRRLRLLNQVAALVWRHCDGERTIEDLVKVVSENLSVPADESVVWLALSRLQKAELLETAVEEPVSLAGIERRELLLKAAQALAGVVVVPSVLALSASSEMPAEGASSRVVICHKGNTIEVDEHAVGAHLAHGDTLGPCEVVTSSTTTRAPGPTTLPPRPTTPAPIPS